MYTIEQLRAKLGELNAKAQDIRSKAEAENRDLTDEEVAGLDIHLREFDVTKAKLDQLERLESQTLALAEPAGSFTAPSAAAFRPGPSGREVRIESNEPRGSLGFSHLGEFAMAVRAAEIGAGFDPRLVKAAPTDVGTGGVPADGGYAVPPDFREAIINLMGSEESILSLTDQYQTAFNTITFPVDEDPNHSGNGITTYWVAEAGQITQSKPLLDQVQLPLHKLAALVPVSDELLADAPGMNSYLNRKTPEKMVYAVNDALLTGNGTGKPEGALASPCRMISPACLARRTASPLTSMWI